MIKILLIIIIIIIINGISDGFMHVVIHILELKGPAFVYELCNSKFVFVVIVVRQRQYVLILFKRSDMCVTVFESATIAWPVWRFRKMLHVHVRPGTS